MLYERSTGSAHYQMVCAFLDYPHEVSQNCEYPIQIQPEVARSLGETARERADQLGISIDEGTHNG